MTQEREGDRKTLPEPF